MVPHRNRKTEDMLEHAMQRRGVPKVLAADDVGDPLDRIVVDDGEVISWIARVLPDQHRIARPFDQLIWIDAMPSWVERTLLGEPQLRHGARGGGEVETQGVTGSPVGDRPPAARPGIDQPLVAGRRSGLDDLPSRAGAGIEQPPRREPVGNREVFGAVIGLAPNVPIPAESQPPEVVEYACDVLRPTTRAVRVLDPQKEMSSPFARDALGGKGTERMAEVERPRRRGRETRSESHSAAAAGMVCASSHSDHAAFALSV